MSNGCEGFTSNIFIPDKSELISTMDTTLCKDFAIHFNAQHQNMTRYQIWFELQFEALIEEESILLAFEISEFLSMVCEHYKKRIKNISTKYPRSIKPNVVLFFFITYALFWIIVLIF